MWALKGKALALVKCRDYSEETKRALQDQGLEIKWQSKLDESYAVLGTFETLARLKTFDWVVSVDRDAPMRFTVIKTDK